MSFPAARISDMTAHGGAVSLGAPTTLIGGMPASRVGDIHACPFVTVLVPHATGPIVLGAFNVLVGGPPQARMLDMCVCVGPPSIVMLGSFTTLVGMAAAFSGGIGGALGVILGAILAVIKNLESGFPKAVKCPKDAANPAGYYTQFASGVIVRGTPEFQASTVQDLNTIASTKAGQNTLSRLAKSGHTVTIEETTNSNGDGTSYADADKRMRPTVGGANAAGTDSTISFYPKPITIYDGSQPWMSYPPDVALYHELRHSADASEGAMDPGNSTIDGRVTRNREAQASGLGPYAADPTSENGYRAERGQPPRTFY